jgi:hypothetical protein
VDWITDQGLAVEPLSFFRTVAIVLAPLASGSIIELVGHLIGP